MKHTKHPVHSVALAAMAVLVFMAAPAVAEVTEDTAHLEGGLGYYVGDSVDIYTEEFEIESDLLINVRGGWFFTERWGLEGQLWRADTEATLSGPLTTFLFGGDISGDVTVWGLDASAVYCTNPAGKHNFLVVGGVGYSSAEDEAGDDEGSLTLNLGVAGRINVTDNFYVRPDARYLYVNDIMDESFNNFLITVNVGWVFGG
ncbi:MAG: porin family protein [Acidobacteriota bacterium]|nr:MAG: porin family protein [Acidobacteriota bacterium]